MRGPRRLSVDPHAKPDASATQGRAHHDVKIARVKTIHDAADGPVQQGGLSAHRPLPRQGPLIEAQAPGYGVSVAPIKGGAARGREALGAFVTDVGLRRSKVVPVRPNLQTPRLDRYQVGTQAFTPGLGQQSLYDLLRLFVVALARFSVPNVPGGVGQVQCRPRIVPEGTPDREVIVDGNRIVDLHLRGGLVNVGEVLLEVELWRVNTDHHQSSIAVLFGPRANIRQ